MTLSGSRRREALAGQTPRRHRWRLRVAALISVLLHLSLGLALLVTIRGPKDAEMLPPPSDVTLVFETGKKGGPTTPEPSLQATPRVMRSPQAATPWQ
jgi:hypothetical protein